MINEFGGSPRSTASSIWPAVPGEDIGRYEYDLPRRYRGGFQIESGPPMSMLRDCGLKN